MQTNLTAVTALAGSLLLAPLMLGPTQAGSAPPNLKSAMSATHDGAITLVGHGGAFLMVLLDHRPGLPNPHQSREGREGRICEQSLCAS